MGGAILSGRGGAGGESAPPPLSPYQQYTLLLDQSRTIQTGYCEQPIGEARHRKNGKHVRLPCNKWTCDQCGPQKVKRLRVRFALGDLNPTWFLTATLHTSDPTLIMSAWNLFLAGLRKDGYNPRYMLAKEFTRKGKRHLHVIGEGWIPYRELSKRWKRATHGSKWIHVRPAHHKARAVGYVTKYMTKAAGSRMFDKGERRYSASRGVLWPAWKPPGDWDVFLYCTRKGKVGTYKVDDYTQWFDRSWRDFNKSLGPPPPQEQISLPAEM